MITFGPVPSRRLGRSLGINNIPPKACSYSCVYCQLGPTARQEIQPRPFYTPQEILVAVESSLEAATRSGDHIDYLTFVPDGEPTLDNNLGKTIDLLQPLGIKIAVISNASLIWREDVRDNLAAADWLSVKVDAVEEAVWRHINQPHPQLQLQQILDGIQLLAKQFTGVLTTETMLVDGINDGIESVTAVANYLEQLIPNKAWLAVPIRPPAESGIKPPPEEKLNRAFQMLSNKIPHLELLVDYEGDAFTSTGDIVEDLLSITAVHPMREEAVLELLDKTGNSRDILTSLVNEGRLKQTEYQGTRFYLRTFNRHD
ncbi:MAG: radical SAM protein [Chromatiales bacterium]|jgi:wyosine [tRNA(Phe)-imidazoG37] synthetase (radical SAM superfamily)